MKKRLTAMLLSLCMMLTLLPASAFAAGNGDAQTKSGGVETYDLYIAGTQVTSENADDILGDGTVSFNPDTSTLTLDNATIEADNDTMGIRSNNFSEGITIQLNGYNQILTEEGRGIYGSFSDFIIKGTQTDTLKIESDGACIQVDNSNLTIDGCIIDATSFSWEGIMVYGNTQHGKLNIQNGADLTINCQALAVLGESKLDIQDSHIMATTNGAQSNTLNSSGDMLISNSTITATGTSEEAYPSIYAYGDIFIEKGSDVTAESKGLRGIYTDSSLFITDSSVTATGSAGAGIFAVNTLTLDHAKVTASGNPTERAIIAYQCDVTASDVTAKGGIRLFNPLTGTYDGISLNITPADDTLTELKVDATNVGGSASTHFSGDSISPYDSAVNLSESEIRKLSRYKYVHIGEHIHTGGTATCQAKAICKDCGREYGEKDPDHHVWNDTFTVEQAPSCTENGYQSIHCQYCSDTKDGQEIKALGHSFTHYEYNNNATYAANGTETAKCDRCAATDTREKAGTMLTKQDLQQNTLALYKKSGLTWKKNNLLIRWAQVKNADGYDIFATECTKSFGKKSLIKTVSANKKKAVIKKIKGKKLDTRKNYKVKIQAFRIINGEKQYLTSPITFHTAGKKSPRYTNAKSIKLKNKKLVLKAGKKQKLSASIVKENAGKQLLPQSHAPYLRYQSSNPAIAKVNGKGILKAKKKGTCTIYVYAQNGISKKMKITVR